MVDIIDKAKEKAKDIKDTVVDNTKDVVDAAKESFEYTNDFIFIIISDYVGNSNSL